MQPTEAWTTIEDPQASDAQVQGAIAALRHERASEPAARWAAVANDARFGPRHRRLALLELFRRHVTAGVDVVALAGGRELSAWFGKDHVSDQTRAAKLPFDRRRGGTVIMLRPNLPPANNSAVYLLLSRVLSPAELSDLAHAAAPLTIVTTAILEDDAG